MAHMVTGGAGVADCGWFGNWALVVFLIFILLLAGASSFWSWPVVVP